MDIEENLTGLNSNEDFFQDQQDELRKHIGISAEKYITERNKYGIYNSEFFRDSLDKTVLGQEKKSMEIFFKRFFDTMIQKTKFDSTTLKQINPLEFLKKDFSSQFQELVNVEAFNYEFINKFINKDDLMNNKYEKDNIDMLFDEKNEISANDINKSNINSNKNIGNYKNNAKPNMNNLSAFFGNKYNINMNNSNVSSETLYNSGLLNRSINNLSNRNIIDNNSINFNKNIITKTNNKNTSSNKLDGIVFNDFINEIANKKVDLEKNFNKLEEDENNCCVEDEDFNTGYIKIDKSNPDSEMFVSEISRSINKNPLLKKNDFNPKSNFRNNNKKNLIRINSEETNKHYVKVENDDNEDIDINIIRATYNLAEKAANVLNKDINILSNTQSSNLDITKKPNKVSILDFINKGKKTIENLCDIDLKSDFSDNFDNIKNKLAKGKRKNVEDSNDFAKKNLNKKKNPNFK